ncbi:MAG: WGxxGxxG family protein [Prochloraceae cyanobacterium]
MDAALEKAEKKLAEKANWGWLGLLGLIGLLGLRILI